MEALYPGAKVRLITHNFGIPGDNLSYRFPYSPVACVAHSAEGDLNCYELYQKTPGYVGSTHLEIFKDGSVEQYVPFTMIAWGNGVMNRIPRPTYPAWLVDCYRTGKNPNTCTISWENQGFKHEKIIGIQWQRNIEVSAWVHMNVLYQEPSRGTIVLHSQISNTDCPGGRYSKDELISLTKEKMTEELGSNVGDHLEELENDTKALSKELMIVKRSIEQHRLSVSLRENFVAELTQGRYVVKLSGLCTKRQLIRTRDNKVIGELD